MPKTFEVVGSEYGTAARRLGIRKLYASSKNGMLGIQAEDSYVSLLGEQSAGLLTQISIVLTKPDSDVEFTRFQALSSSLFAFVSGEETASVSREIEAKSDLNRKSRKIITIQRENYKAFFAEEIPESPGTLAFSVFRCRYE